MTSVMSSVLAHLASDQVINERRTHRRTPSQQRSQSTDRFSLPDVQIVQSTDQSINQPNSSPPINQSNTQPINQSPIKQLINGKTINQSISNQATASPSHTSDMDAESPQSSNENTPSNASPSQSNPTKRDPAAQQKALMRQIEYYFSNQNLWKDAYLLAEMSKNEQQFIDLSVIAGLKKVAKLSSGTNAIIEAIKASNKLELNSEQTMVKRVQPLPPYDQLKDAHRSLYVSNLPAGSTLKSVKKLFSIFGKVTYVLRADQIDSAAPLNSSPHVSPVIHASSPPISPMLVPRLSLGATHQSISLPSTPTNASGSVTIPTMSASDSIETPFSSAYVQFEKPASMQRALELIQAIPKSNSSATPKQPERILSISSPHLSKSPILGRRTLGAGASPIPSSRALSSHQTTSQSNSDVSNLLAKRALLGHPSASPSQSKRRIGIQTHMIDVSLGSDMSPQVASPSSPQVQILDASATPSQLPPVFATFTVMSKIDRLRGDQSDDEEKKPSITEKETEKQVKTNKLNSSNWRNLNYQPVEPSNKPPLSDDDAEEKPVKQANSKNRVPKNRAVDRNPALVDDNIIHISPKPSPRMPPSPATPIMAYPLHGQSPGNSPALLAGLGPALPALDLNKPRFSLTKRSSVAANHVASRFALGPDAPESKGFAGRGRGKPVMS